MTSRSPLLTEEGLPSPLFGRSRRHQFGGRLFSFERPFRERFHWPFHHTWNDGSVRCPICRYVSCPPVSHLFAEGGGIVGRGLLGGLGVLGGAGYVPPLEQAQGGSFSHPHDSGFIFQDFINPRTQTSLKDVYSLRRQNTRHYVWGRWAPPNASAWPPRSWIFTLCLTRCQS